MMLTLRDLNTVDPRPREERLRALEEATHQDLIVIISHPMITTMDTKHTLAMTTMETIMPDSRAAATVTTMVVTVASKGTMIM